MAKVLKDTNVIDGSVVDYTFAPARINYSVDGRPNAAEGPGVIITSEKVKVWFVSVPKYWRDKLSMYFGIRGLLVTSPYHADRAVLQAKLETLENVFKQNNVPYSAVAEHATVVWEVHGIRRQIQLVAAEEAIDVLLATFKSARVEAPPAANGKKASEKAPIPAVPVLEL